MASTAQKWLMGCGIGCGVMILLGAMVIGGGIYWARGLADRFDSATDSGTALEEKHGRAEDYVPAPHGAVPAARVEAFLAVRDSLAVFKTRFDETFATFRRLEEKERAGGGKPNFLEVLQAVRGGVGMAPLLGDYFAARGRALAAADMGPGEYAYVYGLAYYSLLGKAADAGPRQDPDDEGDVEPGEVFGRRAQRLLLTMLENQLAGLDAASPPVAPSWRDSLAAEIAALRADDGRVPWAGGLPPAVAASLAPYRDRFEATWSENTNPFELGRLKRHRGGVNVEFGK